VLTSPSFAHSSRDLTSALEVACAGWLHPQVQQLLSPCVASQCDLVEMRFTTAIFAIPLVENGAEFPFLSARVPCCKSVASNSTTTTTGTNDAYGPADLNFGRALGS
jgi:hypothetical protein